MLRQSPLAACVRVTASVALLFLASPALASPTGTAQAQSSLDFIPVTDAMLQDPAPGDWLMWRRTLDSWGYSPLDQVNRENVGELRMVWTRNLAARTVEITPLAYGGVLYVPQAEDIIQALDAVTGDFIWEYRRDIPDDLYGFVGGNARNNRNIAIYDRLIINTSDDNFVFALDALTGETGSSRRGPARCHSWRPAAGSSSVAIPTGASGPSTTRRARFCGRSISARRSAAIRSPTLSTDSSTWRSTPGPDRSI